MGLLLDVQTDNCRWFALEEMKVALGETHCLLGPEPIELVTIVANLKGLYNKHFSVSLLSEMLL